MYRYRRAKQQNVSEFSWLSSAYEKIMDAGDALAEGRDHGIMPERAKSDLDDARIEIRNTLSILDDVTNYLPKEL